MSTELTVSTTVAFGRDWSKVRGFNYQPSNAYTGVEVWQDFDPDLVRTELYRGKTHFPQLNTLRIWHSWDAFQRDPPRYVSTFDAFLGLASEIDCVVMPVLFNRWRMLPLDFGGIYIDHFLPGSTMMSEGMFEPYLEDVVGRFAADKRVMAWDLCNEPYWYDQAVIHRTVVEAESAWLQMIYDRCKELNAAAPLTLGAHLGTKYEQIDAVSDIISIHPYFAPEILGYGEAQHEKVLDDYVVSARH